jgi:hypothetical protein
MIHLFQEALNLFDEVKAKIEGAATAATTAVSSGIAWSDDEIKAAEVAVFTKVETTSMTLSQAFKEGAAWAAARVQSATAAPAAAATTATAEAAPVAATAADVAPIVAATMAPEAPVAAPATDASATQAA